MPLEDVGHPSTAGTELITPRVAAARQPATGRELELGLRWKAPSRPPAVGHGVAVCHLGGDLQPAEATIAAWPEFTPGRPLRVIVSGCLAGRSCGVDGSTNGEYPIAAALLTLPNGRVVDFCPGDFAFGTPRATPNIHGGDGFDVLDGRARVRTDDGADWTEGMVRASRAMLDLAQLMDTSAACGSQVVYDGPRRLRVYRAGVGVAAAMLVRSGIPVVSQRDFRTLGLIFAHLERPDLAPSDALDHHESDWYRRCLKRPRP